MEFGESSEFLNAFGMIHEVAARATMTQAAGRVIIARAERRRLGGDHGCGFNLSNRSTRRARAER
jgi:hypothetical protein